MLRGTSCQNIYPASPERRRLAGDALTEASAPEHPCNVLRWKPTHRSRFCSAPTPLGAAGDVTSALVKLLVMLSRERHGHCRVPHARPVQPRAPGLALPVPDVIARLAVPAPRQEEGALQPTLVPGTSPGAAAHLYLSAFPVAWGLLCWRFSPETLGFYNYSVIYQDLGLFLISLDVTQVTICHFQKTKKQNRIKKNPQKGTLGALCQHHAAQQPAYSP